MFRALAVSVVGIFVAVPALAAQLDPGCYWKIPGAYEICPNKASPPALAQQQQQYWYYCDSAKAYYPYIQTCPEQWRAVSAGQQTGPTAEDVKACANEVPAPPPGDAQAATASRQAWRDCLARYQQQREQDAAQQVEQQKANAESEQQLRTAIAKKIAADDARGYKHISFDDFVLDGRTMAENHAKVSISGRYVKYGSVEYLTPSPMASARLNSVGDTGESVGLLTDQADRNTRKYFLECQKSNQTLALGCGVTLLGHVTTCVKTIFLNATNEPCLEVDSGWWLSSN